MLSLALTAALSCGSDEPEACPPLPTEMVAERPVGPNYRSPYLTFAELDAGATPSLVTMLTNRQPTIERVRLSIDGTEVVDVDLPALADCNVMSNPPTFAFGFDRPPGPGEVVLTLQGATSVTTVAVPASGTAWTVVDVQSKREWSDLQVFDSRPGWD